MIIMCSAPLLLLSYEECVMKRLCSFMYVERYFTACQLCTYCFVYVIYDGCRYVFSADHSFASIFLAYLSTYYPLFL